jgi:hypothetical protein
MIQEKTQRSLRTSSSLLHNQSNVTSTFENNMITTTILGPPPLDGGPLVNPGISDEQILGVGSSFVGTGNGGAKDFVDKDSGPLVGELQEVQSLGSTHTTDKVNYQSSLSRGDTGESM